MVEDLRVCSHCKKTPPPGKKWADYHRHLEQCPKRPRGKRTEADKRALDAAVRRFTGKGTGEVQNEGTDVVERFGEILRSFGDTLKGPE